MNSEYRKGLSLEKAGDLEGALKIFDKISESDGDEEIANYARVRANNIRIDMAAKAEASAGGQAENEALPSDDLLDGHEYAGFWIRLGAALIDAVLIGLCFYVPLVFIYGVEYLNGDKLLYGAWDFMFSYVFPFIATVWFWLRFSGTPGKMALGLKVVDSGTFMKMSTGQAIGRYFAYIPSTLVFLLGYIWVAVDSQKKGWHDKLAGTAVIRKARAE